MEMTGYFSKVIRHMVTMPSTYNSVSSLKQDGGAAGPSEPQKEVPNVPIHVEGERLSDFQVPYEMTGLEENSISTSSAVSDPRLDNNIVDRGDSNTANGKRTPQRRRHDHNGGKSASLSSSSSSDDSAKLRITGDDSTLLPETRTSTVISHDRLDGQSEEEGRSSYKKTSDALQENTKNKELSAMGENKQRQGQQQGQSQKDDKKYDELPSDVVAKLVGLGTQSNDHPVRTTAFDDNDRRHSEADDVQDTIESKKIHSANSSTFSNDDNDKDSIDNLQLMHDTLKQVRKWMSKTPKTKNDSEKSDETADALAKEVKIEEAIAKHPVREILSELSESSEPKQIQDNILTIGTISINVEAPSEVASNIFPITSRERREFASSGNNNNNNGFSRLSRHYIRIR